MRKLVRSSHAATWMIAICLTLPLAAPAPAINFITNPGFEAYTGTYSAIGGRQLLQGQTGVTGWDIVGGEIGIFTTPNVYQITASEGLNLLDLSGYQNTLQKGISQTITGLTVGQAYEFSADLGISNDPVCIPEANCGGPVSVSVTIGSTTQTLTHQSLDAGVVWTSYGFPWTADSDATTLTILAAMLPTAGALIGLDNLSLTPVADPCDLNGDGAVDAADAATMFANWGDSPTDLRADKNSDGLVDAADAASLFAAWTGDASVVVVPEPGWSAFAGLIAFLGLRCRLISIGDTGSEVHFPSRTA